MWIKVALQTRSVEDSSSGLVVQRHAETVDGEPRGQAMGVRIRQGLRSESQRISLAGESGQGRRGP